VGRCKMREPRLFDFDAEVVIQTVVTEDGDAVVCARDLRGPWD
jgi:hypothetical protein